MTTASPSRVLVIDDDPFMCEALAMALGSDGHEVRTATSGNGLDQSLSEFRPSVTLVDLHLPDGPDGVSIARRFSAR